MVEKNGVLKCNVCGNVLQVIHASVGEPVCCDQKMELMSAKEEDMGMEKHVPVIEITDGKVIVKVGEIFHPMEEEHYIQMIELLKGDVVIAHKHLVPGEKPIAEFCIDIHDADGIEAREYCNIHGLWKG